MTMCILAYFLAFFLLLVLYLFHAQRAMEKVPAEVLNISPHRWLEKEIKDTYKRLQADPIDFTGRLPPKLDRRYVVVGGSG